MKLNIEKLETLSELMKLKHDWEQLFCGSGQTNIFLTWEWLSTWWKHFGNQGKLHVLACYKNEQLVGVAPLYIRKQLNSYGQKVVTFLGSAPISSDYLDIIHIPELKQDIAELLANALWEDKRHWDCIELCDFIEPSSCAAALSQQLYAKGLCRHRTRTEICPFLEMPQSEADLLDRLDSRLRSTIKRKQKRALKQGATFRQIESGEALDTAMKALFELHQKRWNNSDNAGSFHAPEIRAFHLEVAQILSKIKGVALHEAHINEKVIASLYVFRCAQHVYYYQSGYDPDWHTLSPGTLVMWQALKQHTQAQERNFDFLRGDEPYKLLWTKRHRTTSTYIHYAPHNLPIIAKLLINKAKQTTKKIMKSFYEKAAYSPGQPKSRFKNMERES